MSELKKCPFCGGKAICSNWGMWRAWCSECKSKGSDELTEKEAVAAWNRRAQPENEPLVRCGECKDGHKEPYGELWCGRFDGGTYTSDNDFCSHGERKPERSEG